MENRYNVVPTYPDKTVGSIKIDDKTYYVCNVCGRLTKHKIKAFGKTYCYKHYRQQKRFGKTLDENPRTLYDRNECYIKGKICYVMIYDKECNHIATAKVDKEDLDKVRYIKWKKSANGYAMNTPKFKGSTVHMSRVILNTDKMVDHINHDTLDNRKSNLRIITKSQNQMNANYKGVRETPSGNFYAHIKLNGKSVYLGTYLYEDEALYARWYAEKLLFKEFRYPKPEPELLESRKKFIQKYVCEKVQRL